MHRAILSANTGETSIMRFDGKTAIITGGAKGIGRATTLRFLKEGGQLVVIDLEPEDSAFVTTLRTEAAEAGNRLVYLVGDATDEASVATATTRAQQAIGVPDILINNVGFGANPKAIEETSLEEWNRFLSINLTSAFLLSRAVLPGMRARGSGAIVNLASLAGRSISEISHLHYSTAKAAILGFTRKLAFEEGPNGIRANSVCPGTVFTDRVRTRYEALDPEDLARRMSAVPMRRAARPEEIAAAILYLASDDASYITGAALDVNGGRFMS